MRTIRFANQPNDMQQVGECEGNRHSPTFRQNPINNNNDDDNNKVRARGSFIFSVASLFVRSVIASHVIIRVPKEIRA